MSEETLVQLCAPTLAGLKTGNLFAAEYHSPQEVRDQVRRLNRVLVPRGLRAMPMRYGKARALIYVYRPDRLQKDLMDEQAKSLLREQGYDGLAPAGCLSRLRQRLTQNPEFPHEIGLFLGYPPEDVRGFMEHRPCKCVGCWKVYGDPAAAERVFRQYKKCTETYCNRWRKGATLSQLIVAGERKEWIP